MTALSPSTMASQLQLRRLRLDDIDAMMTIESSAFGRFHWSAQAFEQEMNNHLARYWVVLADETVVGYFGYWLVYDEVHITTLAIATDYRGQGLGELLLAKAIEQAQGHSARTVTLEVRRNNQAAQQLYAKYRLNVLGIRPRYYQDNQEDALIMTNDNILDADFRAHFKHCKQALFDRLQGCPSGF